MFILLIDEDGRAKGFLEPVDDIFAERLFCNEETAHRFKSQAPAGFDQTSQFPNNAVILFDTHDIVEYCKLRGRMVMVEYGHQGPYFLDRQDPDQRLPEFTNGPMKFVELDFAEKIPEDQDGPATPSGIRGKRSNVYVPESVRSEFIRKATEERGSPEQRVSNISLERTFVYVDVSGFSKYKPGQEALIINSLAALVHNRGINWGWQGVRGDLEAELCIGDGYIYVFHDPLFGTYFAAYLACLIERLVAEDRLPVDFHFRMGVHVGQVYSFWDRGRRGWNYIGAGINGGNRIISVIKDADDIVFVSGEVREVLNKMASTKDKRPPSGVLLKALQNRGRRQDKHGVMWRVYELDHTTAAGEAVQSIEPRNLLQ